MVLPLVVERGDPNEGREAVAIAGGGEHERWLERVLSSPPGWRPGQGEISDGDRRDGSETEQPW